MSVNLINYISINTIVFLDNNLAFRGEINLSNFGISQASAIARSYDNGIWLFDIADLQLKKMNKDGNITLQSSNVRQFRNYAKNVLPNYIYDNNDKLYLNDSAVGVMVFDVFANYIKLINIAHLCNFKIIDDELFYIKQNTLFSYNLKTLSYNGNALPSSRPLECSVEKDRLYLMYENNVEIYKMW
ncbi:MAG: hypothetical protein NTU43_04570 [Bacteroidetes bacterium]|nr:hypothetical protein [Bacteroidota bacterium]